MKTNTWGWFKFVALIIMLGVPVAFHFLTGQKFFEITIAMLIILGAIFLVCEYLFWRCPHCGKYIGTKGFHVKCCPECGKQIE